MAAPFIADKPTRAYVVADEGTPQERRLEEKWFFYNGLESGLAKGNVSKVESWIDQWAGNPAPCSRSAAQTWVSRI